MPGGERCWGMLAFEVICEHMMEAIKNIGLKGRVQLEKGDLAVSRCRLEQFSI